MLRHNDLFCSMFGLLKLYTLCFCFWCVFFRFDILCLSPLQKQLLYDGGLWGVRHNASDGRRNGFVARRHQTAEWWPSTPTVAEQYLNTKQHQPSQNKNPHTCIKQKCVKTTSCPEAAPKANKRCHCLGYAFGMFLFALYFGFCGFLWRHF